MDGDWRPTISIEAMIERARTLEAIRAFFARRGVIEVDTPVLSRTTVTDPAIDSFALLADGERRYLQTSPEYQMKRLLAAGAPSIVRIGPVFRAEESGRLHNPEFTMIEWYRLGFDLPLLMDEVEALVDLVLGVGHYRRISYRQLLLEGAGVASIDDPEAVLGDALRRNGIELSTNATVDRRDMLDLLVAHAIEALGPGRFFITDYPPDQAALARLVTDSHGYAAAARFELIVDAVEIANGYHELADADVLAQRMAQDRAVRARSGREQPAADDRLLAAMRHGLPDCAGVALGFDRLMMLHLRVDRLDQAMPFSSARA